MVTLTTDDSKLSRHIWASKQAVIYKARQTENSEPRVPIGWRQQAARLVSEAPFAKCIVQRVNFVAIGKCFEVNVCGVE